MKLWKPLAACVAVTVFDMVSSALTCGWLFNWVYHEEPTCVWQPMGEKGPEPIFYVGILVLNLILVGVYLLLRKGLPGGRVVKGLVFGVCVWAVGMLPGMWATYSFMTVATTVVVYWTLSGLVYSPIKGVIIAGICGK